jgi:Icc-related predicted phosphoesterase
VIRVAAIGDLHVKHGIPDALAQALVSLATRAEALVIAGDMTDNGRILEFEIVAEAMSGVGIPVIAVLGNHDRRCLRRTALRRVLERGGIILLDGQSVTLELPVPGSDTLASTTSTVRIGFAGVGGYGGGFWPEEGPLLPPYRAAQALAVRARREAVRLDEALSSIDDGVDLRIAVLHYAPTSTTLGSEPVAKHWMLGNIELGHVIDRHPVDLVIHGHAHLGNAEGTTPGGTPVRNVASHVIGLPVVHVLHVSTPVDTASTQFAEDRPGISA